jgi:hypothetical protein
MRPRLLLGASVLCGLLVPMLAAGGEAVRTPRILRDGAVDTSSVESIIAAIIRPGMSQPEKALAVYEFLRTHLYHQAAAREGARPDDHEYGVVYDPVKLINVYGYGYCFQSRSALEALWQAAGLEARSAGIGGHSVAEVFHDGAYHYLDADQHGYCLLPDGRTIASIEQISRDPIALILKQANPTKPFFPATADPKVPYESKHIVASYFASTADNFYQHDKTVTGHRMDVTLLPGMRYVRRFGGDGRWNVRNKSLDFEYQVGYVDPRVGPKDFITGRGCGNGELLYQPELSGSSREYAAGVWQHEGLAQTRDGLEPAEAGKPGWCVFRIRLPYVIAGWPTAFKGPAKPAGAAVVAAAFRRAGEKDAQGISVSTDGGRTWKPVWKAEGTGSLRAVADLSEHVAGRYEYLLRFELAAAEKPADARLERLAVNTAFQLAPRTLPAVEEGANRFTFSLGDGSETAEMDPDLSSAEALLRDAESAKGIWFEPGQIVGRRGREGEVIYKLEPPRPGTVKGFSAGAGCRREPFGLRGGDDVRIYYAENEPRDWKLIYDDDVPRYFQHWSYEADARAECSPETRRAYVKFGIRTEASQSVQRLRLAMRWLPAEGAGLPERGVRVEHAWTEGGKPRTFSKILKTAPAGYEFAAGKDVVNSHVLIEPVREKGLQWRPDDPPVVRPPEPAEQVLNEALRDELRSLLRKSDADPEKGLAEAAASKIQWLADGARQAQAMLRSKYPAMPPAPSFGGDILQEAGRALGRKEAAGAADADALAELVAKEKLAANQAVPAAALLLLGDKRGVEPLAGHVKDMPAARVMPLAVLLLKAGNPAGRKAVAAIMAGGDPYNKLALLEAVEAAGIKPVPDELLAGLSDGSRWVRLAVLEMLRRSPTESGRRAVEKMAKEDPLEFLRAEAASVLAAAQERK